MFTSKVQLTDVVYNAASQQFEATVTIYDQGTAKRYACAIDAPITMSFSDAAMGLKTKAQRQHAKLDGLASSILPTKPRRTLNHRTFDLTVWLQGILKSRNPFAA